jgi:hypothetical protein
MNEDLKKYAPWLVGGIIVFYVLYKLVGGRGAATAPAPIVPQTQITQTPQTDPFAELRGQAYQQLSSFGLGAIQAEAQAAIAQSQAALQAQTLGLQYQLGSQQIDAQTQQAGLLAQAQNYASQQAYAAQQAQAAAQQSAINQYYSMRNQQSILGSVNTALGTLLGGFGGANVFTPPIF